MKVSKKARHEGEAFEPPLFHTNVAKSSHNKVASPLLASELMPLQQTAKITDLLPRYPGFNPQFKYLTLPLIYNYEGCHNTIVSLPLVRPDEPRMDEYIYPGRILGDLC